MDSDFVSPMTPHFAAAYGVGFGKPKRPAAEERLAMLALRLVLTEARPAPSTSLVHYTFVASTAMPNGAP